MINANALAMKYKPLINLAAHTTTSGWSPSNKVSDPVYDATYEAAAAATTIEELNRLAGEADMYAIEQHWQIWGPFPPTFMAIQPWVIGFNGETWMGVGQHHPIFARLWIDSELKEAMGH